MWQNTFVHRTKPQARNTIISDYSLPPWACSLIKFTLFVSMISSCCCFFVFFFSIPLGVSVTSPSTGQWLRPRRQPAEHQTRRQHTLPPAGLPSAGWRPRAGMGGREEELPVGEESVGRVGKETYPGQGWKEEAEGRSREQDQRSSAVDGTRQRWRHLLACVRGIPRVQPGLGAGRRHREPLWHSTPDEASVRRISIEPRRSESAPGSASASSESLGLTDRGVEGTAGRSWRTGLLQRGRFRRWAGETSEPGVA